MTIYKNITDAFGNTPLVEINHPNSKGKIYAKLEFYNPSKSIKDRLAIAMVTDAENMGKLKKGGLIVEASSGNTGIALAMIASAKGYKCVIVMPSSVSAERKELLKAYGAEVVLTDAELGMAGATNKAEEIAIGKKGVLMEQFKNISGPMIHYNTTGAEILSDLNGNLNFLVSGIGTGGTISGTGRRLKEHDKNIKVIGVQPASSSIFTGGNPGSHKISGIGPNFIPDIYDPRIVDEIISISDEDAWESCRWLGKNTGILAGISSGATFSAALKISEKNENKNKKIVVVFASYGERYLSTNVYNTR
jgi:cysteine synthase A